METRGHDNIAERSLRYTREHFDELVTETEAYVRQNPVRHGLVNDPEDWPFQGELHLLDW